MTPDRTSARRDRTPAQLIAEGRSLIEPRDNDPRRVGQALLLFHKAAARYLDAALLDLAELEPSERSRVRSVDFDWQARASLALRYQLLNRYQYEALLSMEATVSRLRSGTPYPDRPYYVHQYRAFVAGLCRLTQHFPKHLSPLVPEEAFLPPPGGDGLGARREQRERRAASRTLAARSASALATLWAQLSAVPIPMVVVAGLGLAVFLVLIARPSLQPPRTTLTDQFARTPTTAPRAAVLATLAPPSPSPAPTRTPPAPAATQAPTSVAPAARQAAAPVAAAAAFSAEQAVRVAGLSDLVGVVRSDTQRSASEVVWVRNGDILELVTGEPRDGEDGPWLEVRIGDSVGWLPARYLKPLEGRGARIAVL